ncbi:response regulator [Trichothermofontia sp.]
MRILLVDDDESLTQAIAATLAPQQHLIDIATDGLAGWELATLVTYDLLLLDVMLPKLDGISLCRQLRQRQKAVPILMMTARDTSTDKVMGLDAGADDYLVKPFDLDELAARIRALLRRGSYTAQPAIVWADLRLDPKAGSVTYRDRSLQLSPKEYALLELLLRHPQRLFSRNAILNHLWPFEDPPGEDTVKAHIKGLRHKLKAAGASADLIETVYGRGYRLNANYGPTQVTALAGEGATLSPATPSPPAAPTAKPTTTAAQTTRAAVAKIWRQARLLNLERLGVIEQAITALQLGQMEAELHQQAQQAAHKLVGSLGTFGFTEGSTLARQLAAHLSRVIPKEPTSEDCVDKRADEWAHDCPEETLGKQTSDLESLIPGLNSQAQRLRQLLEQAILTPALEQTPAHGHLPRVLIVEPDPSLTEQLAIAAIGWGIHTEIALDLATARTLYEQVCPQAVILDLSFDQGETDAFGFLSELRSCQPDLPILVASGVASLDVRIEVARRGAVAFLQKPIAAPLVMATLARILRQTEDGSIRVLALDQDEAFLQALPGSLAPVGIEVIPLRDPLQFWDVLEATVPHLLLLGVEMVPFSGVNLGQVVRNDPFWNFLPILFVGSQPYDLVMQQGCLLGADGYVERTIAASLLTGQILHQVERSQRLRQQAWLDPLTQVDSRQQALVLLDRLLSLAKRHDHPFTLGRLTLTPPSTAHSLALTHTHQALKRLATHLTQRLRNEDVVARWGPWELLVGMYGARQRDGIDRIAEVLETFNLETFNLETSNLETSNLETSNLNTSENTSESPLAVVQPPPSPDGPLLRVSAGVAQYPQDSRDWPTLCQQAGVAMIQAQAQGGDRVLPAGWQPPQPAVPFNTDVALVQPDDALAIPLIQSLERRGYHTHWLKTATEAIKQLVESPFRAKTIVLAPSVFTDADPHQATIAFLKPLQRQTILQQSRLLLLLANSTHTETYLAMGVFDYVILPCPVSVLLQRIRAALTHPPLSGHRE